MQSGKQHTLESRLQMSLAAYRRWEKQRELRERIERELRVAVASSEIKDRPG